MLRGAERALTVCVGPPLVPCDYKKTRYSEEHNLLPVFCLPFALSLSSSLSAAPLLSPPQNWQQVR